MKDPSSAAEAESSAPRPLLLAGIVFTVAVAVFAPALDGPWLFDDHPLIVENPFVHDLSHWTRWFTHSFWSTSWADAPAVDTRNFWRPLVLASYALDWALGSGSPVVFHATNLLCHGTASALAFLALRRWIGATWPALFAALLWAIHPTKSESVAWIAGRPDLLLGLGVLLALAGVSARLERRPWGWSLELFGALVAYGSKEHAVVLPLLAAIEVCAHAGWPAPRRLPRRELMTHVGPQLLLALAYVAWRQWWLPMRSGGGDWPGLWGRLGIVLETYGRYGVMAVWPQDLSFGSSLIRYAGGARVVDAGFAMMGALWLTACAAGALRWRHRTEWIVGALALPLLLVPVSNAVAVVNIVVASPRLVCLPLLGLALLVGLVLDAVGTARRRIGLSVAALIVALLSARSVIRALDFTDARRFWTYEIECNPRYLPALEFFVVEELRASRPRIALSLAEHAHRGAAATAGQSGAGAVLTHAFESLLIITPDLDRSRLGALRRFVVELRAGQDGSLVGSDGAVTFWVPAHSDTARELARHPMTLAALEARLASRLDDDAHALALVREVAARCPDCNEQRVLVPVAARAEDFALAATLVRNLERTQGATAVADVAEYLADAERRHAQAASAPPTARMALRAWFFAGVGAWGRAHEVARPALADPALAPADGVKVAELAFRAGDLATARALLERWEALPVIEARLTEWALDMGWIDRPRPPEAALPPALAAVVGSP